MRITTLSSREFNQDTSRAKKGGEEGPVFITDRGRPAHVLLTIEHYQKLSGAHASIVELLAMPGSVRRSTSSRRVSASLSPEPVDLS